MVTKTLILFLGSETQCDVAKTARLLFSKQFLKQADFTISSIFILDLQFWVFSPRSKNLLKQVTTLNASLNAAGSRL